MRRWPTTQVPEAVVEPGSTELQIAKAYGQLAQQVHRPKYLHVMASDADFEAMGLLKGLQGDGELTLFEVRRHISRFSHLRRSKRRLGENLADSGVNNKITG